MNRTIGRVIEVFIPEEYNQNGFVDVMDSRNIGFKIMLEDQQIEIIQEQDENNCNIYKGDLVVVTKQVISGKEFVDIELYGDDYES